MTTDETFVRFPFQAFFGPLFAGDEVETTNMTTPVQARYVQFNPLEPLTPGDNHLCLRVDIASCQNGIYTSSTALYRDKNDRKPHTVFYNFGTFSLKLSGRVDPELVPKKVYRMQQKYIVMSNRPRTGLLGMGVSLVSERHVP